MSRAARVGAALHPDIPDHFVHFTGRPLDDNKPAPIAHSGTAEDRLRSILIDGRLRAFRTYQSPPVVCVCEVTRPAAVALLGTGATTRGPYEPWGVVLSRHACIDAGARPVLHLSSAEIDRLKEHKRKQPPMHWRVVRYEPPSPDWMHEREWRFGFSSADLDPGVDLAGLITGIIVGEAGWEPNVPTPWGAGLVLKRYTWDASRLSNDDSWSPK